MKDFLSVDEDYKLWILLSQAADTTLRARQKELDRYDISTAEASVLFAVQAIGERTTPAEITRWLLREPHTVTELLNRMVKKGLVTKSKDLEKKNMVRVSVTEKGRQAYEQSTKRKSIHKVMSALSREERRQLGSYLERLRNKALGELREERPKPPFP
jgi:MarR family 2-MHQ and catechol resistance regulon transcriptional repressor